MSDWYKEFMDIGDVYMMPKFFNVNTTEDGSSCVVIRNKIKCNKCGKELESKSVHDFQMCECGTAADGGHEYLRRCYIDEGYKELSILAWYNEDGSFSHLVAPKVIELENWKVGDGGNK